LVDAGCAVLQTRAAVADEVLQRGQLLQFFGPLLSVTTWGKPAAQPAVALGLNHHEHGLLSEEDLVGTGLADPRSNVLVEDFQQGPGAEGGLTAHASQSGDRGGAVAQEDGQQAAGDREADAFGLGNAGELSLQVAGDDNGVTPRRLEVGEATLQVGDLLLQAGELALVRTAFQVANDGVGLAIQALARGAALPGVRGDVAMLAKEDDGGTGEAIERRYDAHG
jgi:hypothetical protein